MVATPAGIRHTSFYRLDDQLSPGDVLVVNTSATVPGQLDGTRNGSAVVVHIANRLADGTRVVELRTAPDASAPVLDGEAGERISLPAGGVVELIAAHPEPASVGNRAPPHGGGASGGALSSASDDDGGGFQARCASSSSKGRARFRPHGNRLWRGRSACRRAFLTTCGSTRSRSAPAISTARCPISAHQTIFTLPG